MLLSTEAADVDEDVRDNQVSSEEVLGFSEDTTKVAVDESQKPSEVLEFSEEMTLVEANVVQESAVTVETQGSVPEDKNDGDGRCTSSLTAVLDSPSHTTL